ncbi:NADH:flavin oxidoreductase/NADH oxidase [Leucobacter denitrificans]|uniref:NADH:flavin oxidoreductase/NADH oxidase n=1 Tax=Leucobacter denitrificans TaxID=683042 RepID=A0A7G9S6E0_9MICO|nr:NADH:flavin oxidoreductase/NADH oxidase [Leucobacter denitrificans]QNN63415.1 NADH:flavin oxidoreductase/NADH oxidase [Leucobacter denitrificans]
MANPLLFQPYLLRGLEIRNRLWVAPMCQYSAFDLDGVPGNWHLQHLGGLARGGAGLVIVEATAVTPEGRISPQDLGLWNEEQERAFARITPLAHAHGAKIAIQLAHAGRKASTPPMFPGEGSGSIPEDQGGWQTVAPSAIPFSEDFTTPRELTVDEITSTVQAFVDAASRAVRAGFDAVEIHAAHGYLLHEFLSPISNTRQDEYGGSLENRARLAREVVRAVRAEHPDLPMLVRISATDWVDGGFSPHDASIVGSWLIEDGADLIDVSSGANVAGAHIPTGPSYQVALASQVRERGTPVSAVGLITTAFQAEGILASGQADVILLGRPLLANPHLPISWAAELRAPSADSLVPKQYARARF